MIENNYFFKPNDDMKCCFNCNMLNNKGKHRKRFFILKNIRNVRAGFLIYFEPKDNMKSTVTRMCFLITSENKTTETFLYKKIRY